MLKWMTAGEGMRRGLMILMLAVAMGVVAVPLMAQDGSGDAGGEVVQEKISLWSTIQSGGWIGLLIVLMSIVAVALVVEHLITIRRDRLVPPELVQELDLSLAQGSPAQARASCSESDSFLARVVEAGLDQIGSMFGFFDIQNAMQEVSEREVSRLYRKLDYLGFIASSAPMLGLLGTVTGMIQAFNTIAMTEGMARPSELAEGISQALVTTCMGLIVAIPAMFFVSLFRNRIEGIVAEAETAVEKLMGRYRGGAKK